MFQPELGEEHSYHFPARCLFGDGEGLILDVRTQDPRVDLDDNLDKHQQNSFIIRIMIAIGKRRIPENLFQSLLMRSS